MKKLVISVTAILVGTLLLKPLQFWGLNVVDSLYVGDTSSYAPKSNDLDSDPYEKISDSYKAATAVKSSANRSSYANSDTGYGSAIYDSITIAGRTLPVISVGDTTADSGNHVNKYGDKFYYGHNSGAVFGGLVNLAEGSTFSVTLNGATVNYHIAKRQIFEKNRENGRLELNGSGSYMWNVAAARHSGVQYDVSIMTCHGVSYGDGDASERLVLFANRI